jgi:hypothetical protein
MLVFLRSSGKALYGNLSGNIIFKCYTEGSKDEKKECGYTDI